MHNNMNVNVSGPVQPTSTYKTKVLKGNHSFASQVTEPNIKYVIKHNFDLGGESITIPEGCLLEFDGGSISNGTLVGQSTILIYNQPLNDILTATLEGIWRHESGVKADEEDITDLNGELKFKDKAYAPASYSGLGRKILRKNIVNDINTLTQEMMSDANTIYVIQYDFTLGGNITVPANCVLEFDGGSIDGAHTLTFTYTFIEGNVLIECSVAGTVRNIQVTPQMFGAKGDGIADDTIACRNATIVCDNIFIPSGTYMINCNDSNYNYCGIYITRSNVHIKLDNNATLKAKERPNPNPSNTVRSVVGVYGPRYSAGVDNRIENFTFEGGKIDGSRETVNRGIWNPSGDISTWLEGYHNISIEYCKNVTIKDCVLTDAPGDAIYTNATDNLKIIGVTMRRAGRSSISIGTEENILIKDCDLDIPQYVQYSNGNASYDVASCGAICFEPSQIVYSAMPDKLIKDIVIESCNIDCAYTTTGSSQYAILGSPKNLLIKDCHFINVFRGCLHLTYSTAGNRFIAEDFIFENNIVERENPQSYTNGNCFIYSAAIGKCIIKNNFIKNIAVGSFGDNVGAGGAKVGFSSILFENNTFLEYDVIAKCIWASDNEVDGKVFFIGNKSNNCCFCEGWANIKELYVFDNIVNARHYENTSYTAWIRARFFEKAIIKNNCFVLPQETLYFTLKSVIDDGELIIQSNNIEAKSTNFKWFYPDGTYIKADIINNYFKTAINTTLKNTGFQKKMNVINNVFAGAETQFTTDTTDTEHLKLSGNIYIG